MARHAFALLAKVASGAEHEGEVGIGSGFEEHAGLGDGRVTLQIGLSLIHIYPAFPCNRRP